MNGLFSWALLAEIERNPNITATDLRKQLGILLGRVISISQLYTALTRLDGEGYLVVSVKAPTNIRGGRARRLYALTEDGAWQVRKHRAIFSCHSALVSA
jgi:DNA-binding PadR family transcriptional regulator